MANTVLKHYQDFRTIGRGPEWLFDAIENNNMPTMNLLLFLGVDPNIQRGKDTLLVKALMNAIHTLLNAYCNVAQ